MMSNTVSRFVEARHTKVAAAALLLALSSVGGAQAQTAAPKFNWPFAAASAPTSSASSSAPTAPQTLDQAQATVAIQTGTGDSKAAAERDVRSKAMREAANSYGARAGLIRGTFENQQALDKVASTYDATFNFVPLMLTDIQPKEKGGDGRPRLIKPPVVVQARGAFNQLDSRMIRERDAIFRLETNVEFVPVAPNWRAYLYRDMSEKNAALPHYTLMPRNEAEKLQWKQWVADGWSAGYAQAKAILESDLNRLARDFDGMVLYHDLVAQNVLSLPFVATRNDGVTGDDNSMNVNDVTLKITVIPSFQRKPARWVAVATDAKDNGTSVYPRDADSRNEKTSQPGTPRASSMALPASEASPAQVPPQTRIDAVPLSAAPVFEQVAEPASSPSPAATATTKPADDTDAYPAGAKNAGTAAKVGS